jgi:hypothetical protein
MSKVISCGERTVQVKERVALSDIAKKYDIKPGDIVRVTIEKVESEKDENEMIKEVLTWCNELMRLSEDCIRLSTIEPITNEEICAWSVGSEQKEKAIRLYRCSLDSEYTARRAIEELKKHFDGKENVSTWYTVPKQKWEELYKGIHPVIDEFLEIQLQKSTKRLRELEDSSN